MLVKQNYEFWFLTGSQHLYGEETLRIVAEDSLKIVEGLNKSGKFEYTIIFKPVLVNSEMITDICKAANNDATCAGVITWMHTFSPAKMWIKGLQNLVKPLCHLHTQFNREIPWADIDMDYMNLNQSAHGDREYGFINARLRKPRKIVVGYWEDEVVKDKLAKWMNIAIAVCESKSLKVARFGDNMREVAVTEGDKVEAEIKLGWSINGYGVGDLAKVINSVTQDQIDQLFEAIKESYVFVSNDPSSMDSIKEQLKIEIGMRKFLEEGGFTAFTTTFQDLYGIAQLPGMAVQRLMADGYGFGGEGDWKTSALLRLMKIMGGDKGKGTSFMEDYTYHLDKDQPLVLGAHMLEVCPSIAKEMPKILVKPLSIGGKADPARLIFDCKVGKAICASLVDMGGRMRLIINEVEAVEAPKAMPNLPVAQAMWKPLPSFEVGAEAWILAGGAHHTVMSYDVETQDLLDWAEMMDVEVVVIDAQTTIRELKKELRNNDIAYALNLK